MLLATRVNIARFRIKFHQGHIDERHSVTTRDALNLLKSRFSRNRIDKSLHETARLSSTSPQQKRSSASAGAIVNCDHTLALQTREEQTAEGKFGAFRRLKYRPVDNSRLLAVAKEVRKHQRQSAQHTEGGSRTTRRKEKRDITFNMAELSSVFEKEHSTLAEISEEIREEEQKRQQLTSQRNEAGRLFRMAEIMSSVCKNDNAPPSQLDGRVSLLGDDCGPSATSPHARYPSAGRLSRLKGQKMLATPAVQRLALDTLKAAAGELSPELSNCVNEIIETGSSLARTDPGNDAPLAKAIKDRIVCRFTTTATQASTVAINIGALSRKQARKRGTLDASLGKSPVYSKGETRLSRQLVELALAAGIGPKRLLDAELKAYEDAATSKTLLSTSKRRHPQTEAQVDALRRRGEFPRRSFNRAPSAKRILENMKIVHFVSDHAVPVTVTPQHSAGEQSAELVPKIMVASPVNKDGIPLGKLKILTLVHAEAPADPALIPDPPQGAPRHIRAAHEAAVFDLQIKKSFADFRDFVVSKCKLVDPTFLGAIASLPDFRHATLGSLTRHGSSKMETVAAAAPKGTYSLPVDLEWNLMRKMLQKAHELPEVKELLNKLGANHLDVRKHVFRDSDTNALIVNIQHIRQIGRGEVAAATPAPLPFRRGPAGRWFTLARASVARGVESARNDIRLLNAQLKTVPDDDAHADQRSQLLAKIDFHRSQQLLYEEMVEIVNKNDDPNNPKRGHLLPPIAAHYLVHRHSPNVPFSFSFKEKDEARYRTRQALEEEAFAARLTEILELRMAQYPTCTVTKKIADLPKFGKFGTLDEIIVRHPALKKVIEKVWHGISASPPFSENEGDALSECRTIVASNALAALISTMTFAPLELIADLNALSVFGNNDIRRWRLFGSDTVTDEAALLPIPERVKLSARDAAEEETALRCGEVLVDDEVLRRTASEQRMWRDQCLQRLFRCAANRWGSYSAVTGDWSASDRARLASQHLATALPKLSMRLNGLRADDLLQIQRLLECNTSPRKGFDEAAVDIVSKLSSFPPNLREIFEAAALSLRGKDHTPLKIQENEMEAFMRREGATFVGLTPEQITVYHHFDAFQDALSQEVKLTAAIRLALVDSNPEFSLLLSRRRLTRLREQSLCEIANDGIAQNVKSLSPVLTRRFRTLSALGGLPKQNKPHISHIAHTPAALFRLHASEQKYRELDALHFYDGAELSTLLPHRLKRRKDSFGKGNPDPVGNTRHLAHPQTKPTKRRNGAKNQKLLPEQMAPFQFVVPKGPPASKTLEANDAAATRGAAAAHT